LNGSKLNLGIFGGSFNPIHYGHLILAEFARVEYCLSKVIFIPTGDLGYGKEILPISGEHRFNMVSLATSSNPFFSVSRIELERKEPTYTVDTLKKLINIYDTSIYEYYYIVGLDSAVDLLSWKEPTEILNYAYFIVGSRPDYSVEDLFEKLSPINEYFHKIHLLKIPLLEISSNYIRKRLGEGKSIRYLVPELVEDYIINNKLYKEGG
jgi:nicotinate-nucleotide adenylyltransferase